MDILGQKVVLAQWVHEVIRVHEVLLVLLVHPVQQRQVILEQLVGHLIVVV